MTFADLYHLNDKCEKLEKCLPHGDFERDKGMIVIKLSPHEFEELEETLRDCKCLVYDLCQAGIGDVIRMIGHDS